MIYLDNNSTTPVDPEVLDCMLPYYRQQFGNAASTTHEMGRQARQAVETAREELAVAINASPAEIYFTSGATESNNLAIRGLATHRSSRVHRIVSASSEHRAVIDPIKRLSKEGFDVEWIDPDVDGEFDSDKLVKAFETPTLLLSVMLANNEIGVCLDLSLVSRLSDKAGVVLHTDAAQALGKHDIDVSKNSVSMMSFSAHKLYGPKGVGALYVRKGTRLKAILDGGGHESGKRSGTLNVPGIVGFGKAMELATRNAKDDECRIRQLMHLFDEELRSRLDGVHLNGPPLERRLLGNLNYRLDGIDAETLTLNLPQLCISTGSACTSADPEPSHVLSSIGLSEMEARSSIRIGIGRFNTQEEINSSVAQIAEQAVKLRNAMN